MKDNEWNDRNKSGSLTEAQRQEIAWKQFFPQIRFWVRFNLFGILFVLAAPFLLAFFNKILDGGSRYHHYYKPFQLILFLIVLAISLIGMFYIYTAQDRYHLEAVKWLSLAGAVMMCFAFYIFEEGIGHVSENEKKLYWIIFMCVLLHIVSCIKIFKAHKAL